jgi:hypothetical protein
VEKTQRISISQYLSVCKTTGANNEVKMEVIPVIIM